MTIFLTIIHIIVCFTLVLVILLQAGRGQGLGGASFGGGNVQSVLGTRAGDFLTKATTVAAICFLLTSIGLDWLEVKKSRSLLDGMAPASSIDVNAIQKALEQVKEDSAETASVVSETMPRDVTADEAQSIIGEIQNSTDETMNALERDVEEATQKIAAKAEETAEAFNSLASDLSEKADEASAELEAEVVKG